MAAPSRHTPMEGKMAEDEKQEEKQEEDKLSPDRLLMSLKNNVARRLLGGETAGLANEIDRIRDIEKKIKREKGGPQQGHGIPEALKVKRKKYTLSESALKQRRENAQKASEKMQSEGLSTGPKTDEGKKTSSRNSWKHGTYAKSFMQKFAKPCQSTCDDYPCSLIEDGKTQPGGDCLDKEHVYEAYMAILKAVFDNEYEEINALAALETAKNMHIFRDLQEAVIEDGVTVLSQKVDKDGGVIASELKQHPALPALIKLAEVLGWTPKEMLVTPKSVVKPDDDDEWRSIADLMSSLSPKFKKPKK